MPFARLLLIVAVTTLIALAAGFSAASAQVAPPRDAIAALDAEDALFWAPGARY